MPPFEKSQADAWQALWDQEKFPVPTQAASSPHILDTPHAAVAIDGATHRIFVAATGQGGHGAHIIFKMNPIAAWKLAQAILAAGLSQGWYDPAGQVVHYTPVPKDRLQ